MRKASNGYGGGSIARTCSSMRSTVSIDSKTSSPATPYSNSCSASIRRTSQGRSVRAHVDPLLAAWPEPEMFRQVVERLNQWVRTQPPPADWKPDPMIGRLAQAVTRSAAGQGSRPMEFSPFDGFGLQEAAWLRDVGLWAKGDGQDDLDRAQSLFDWTVRNIQLEPDRPNRIPQFPRETLLFGRGTAVERAWVFILLLRNSTSTPPCLPSTRGAGRIKRERGAERERQLGTSVPSKAPSKAIQQENPRTNCDPGAWAC